MRQVVLVAAFKEAVVFFPQEVSICVGSINRKWDERRLAARISVKIPWDKRKHLVYCFQLSWRAERMRGGRARGGSSDFRG